MILPWSKPRSRVGVVVALSLFVGACSSSVAVEAAAPMSVADFQLEGNRICRGITADLQEIQDNEIDDAGFLTGDAYTQMDETRSAGFEQLFQMQPPAAFEADFDELKAIRREWAETANARIPEPDVNLRLGPQWDAAAGRLGLDDCA